jgi:hypothetical protein
MSMLNFEINEGAKDELRLLYERKPMPEKRSARQAIGKRRKKRSAASHRALSPQARRGGVSEPGRTTRQAVAKRRIRSLKRETGGGKRLRKG